MVKIWRRQSYEIDSTRFDVSYLPHSTSITNLHWRKPWHTEQNLDNLLYTFCADSKLRVWVHLDHHSHSIMEMIAEVDMCNIIQPRRLSVGSMSRRRYAFILDSRDFSSATEKAVQTTPVDTSDHALEHLIAIANRSPEICIVLDGLGHMSAWGLENAGTKNKHAVEVFNIAHIGDLNIHFSEHPHRLSDYTQFCVFGGGSTEASISILVHAFDGSISWYDTQITHLFDTAPRHERVRLITSWAGHDDNIKGIVSSQDGKFLCSWTEDGDVIVWKVKIQKNSVNLLLQQSYTLDVNVVDAEFFADSLYLLREDCLHVLPSGTKYDLRKSDIPTRLSRFDGSGRFGVFYNESVDVYNTRPGKVAATLRAPPDSADTMLVPIVNSPCQGQDLMTVSPQGLITILNSSTEKALSIVGSYATAVRNAVHFSAFGGKIALVTREDVLTIWDSALSVCENSVDVRKHQENVGSLEWHVTQQGNLLLAVACTFKIIVLAQRRYNNESCWHTVFELRVRDYTNHAIGRVCFLSDGTLAVGAGNQLFIPEMEIEAEDESAKLVRETYSGIPERRKRLPPLSVTDVVDALNGALPIYHPKVLHLLLNTSRLGMVSRILVSLFEHLKYFTEGDQLPAMLDLDTEDFSSPSTFSKDQSMGRPHLNGDESTTAQLEDIARRLQENLKDQRVPFLSTRDQASLTPLIDVVVQLAKLKSSVDEHALQYLHGLYSDHEDGVPWSGITHASMSNSHEVLVDLVTQHYGGKLTWEAARKSGLFMWLSEPESVRIQMENVGRAEYTKHEDRSPVDCSLYYLALDKKNILQGLWRTSMGVKEKANTIKLLANNFNDPRWKATALKNAYALISRRRFEYAAAFFLLGGSLKDAVGVCVHQIKDLQLAIAISRVHADGDAILKQVVKEPFLPAAAHSLEGRWMACWAYQTILNQPQKAIQSLMRPLHEVLGVEMTTQTLDFRINDPAMTTLYDRLRSASTSAVSLREESTFIVRSAMYLAREGCAFLAISLLRNWEFLQTAPMEKGTVTDSADNKLNVSLEDEEEGDAEEKKKPPPTQFLEPTGDSLLDSFGF